MRRLGAVNGLGVSAWISQQIEGSPAVLCGFARPSRICSSWARREVSGERRTALGASRLDGFEDREDQGRPRIGAIADPGCCNLPDGALQRRGMGLHPDVPRLGFKAAGPQAGSKGVDPQGSEDRSPDQRRSATLSGGFACSRARGDGCIAAQSDETISQPHLVGSLLAGGALERAYAAVADVRDHQASPASLVRPGSEAGNLPCSGAHVHRHI